MSGVSHRIDRFEVVFDDESLVADAGLVAAATLMGRLGLASLVDASVRLGRRPGAAAPGRKMATLVAAMLVGATHIDHVDRLRAGATGAVLGFRPAAPSTVGSFLHTTSMHRNALRFPSSWPAGRDQRGWIAPVVASPARAPRWRHPLLMVRRWLPTSARATAAPTASASSTRRSTTIRPTASTLCPCPATSSMRLR